LAVASGGCAAAPPKLTSKRGPNASRPVSSPGRRPRRGTGAEMIEGARPGFGPPAQVLVPWQGEKAPKKKNRPAAEKHCLLQRVADLWAAFFPKVCASSLQALPEAAVRRRAILITNQPAKKGPPAQIAIAGPGSSGCSFAFGPGWAARPIFSPPITLAGPRVPPPPPQLLPPDGPPLRGRRRWALPPPTPTEIVPAARIDGQVLLREVCGLSPGLGLPPP